MMKIISLKIKNLSNASEKHLPLGGGCKLFNNIEISQLVS